MPDRPASRPPPDVDVAILGIAARQQGVVARSQLLGAGVAAHRIDHRLRRGWLVALHRGVYRVGPVPGRHQREMAAALAGGPDVVVSHRSAAALLELEAGREAGSGVDITSERDIRIRDPGLRIHRCVSLPSDEIDVVEGVPVTSAGRTLLDLAGVVRVRGLELAVARAQRAGLVRPGELEELLERHPGKRGCRRLSAIITADAEPALTRSEAERRFLALVRAAELPAPRCNVRVAGFEVDFLWPRERLVVEVDGYAFHSGTGPFQRDRDRNTLLLARGYALMRVTWRHIARESHALVSRLTEALARRR